MKTLKDILTEEKIKKYQEEWDSFKDKYKVNTSYNVNSGNPVISIVYRFEDKQLFRAHIFGNRLKKHDPYFIAKKYLHPFWHAQHILIVCEQLYTASTKLLIGDDYHKKMAKDVPLEFRWKKELFLLDNISIELIKENKGKRGEYEIEAGYFTFYSDKTKQILSKMSAISFWKPRAYILDIEKIRKGNKQATEDLIRKIKAQDINLKRMTKPRKKLLTTVENLEEQLRNGEMPEEELHDFFSYWEKNDNNIKFRLPKRGAKNEPGR
jgi:hypothetical protein